MLLILPPLFPNSRQAFAAQFSGDSGRLMFRENGIGAAHRVTEAEQQQLVAIHGLYSSINRWFFWAFLLISVVIWPVVGMLGNQAGGSDFSSSVSPYLFLLLPVGLIATQLWARSRLRRLLASLPVVMPALPRREADDVLLNASSWTSLVLPPMVLALALYAYQPALGRLPVLWPLGLIAVGSYFLLLAWHKFRRKAAVQEPGNQ
jgi:hypothetical protein